MAQGRIVPSNLQVIVNGFRQNITTEMAAARVHQIDTLPQFYYISPLGAVQKRLNSTFSGWRRIHDLSFPYGKSVNDGIQEDYGSLIYQTFDNAIRLIQKHGPRCKLRKRCGSE